MYFTTTSCCDSAICCWKFNVTTTCNYELFHIARVIKDIENIKTQMSILQEAQQTFLTVHAAIYNNHAHTAAAEQAPITVDVIQQQPYVSRWNNAVITPMNDPLRSSVVVPASDRSATEDIDSNINDSDGENDEEQILRLATIQGRLVHLLLYIYSIIPKFKWMVCTSSICAFHFYLT